MKDFLLIANKNCITYKEFFPYIKDRIVRIGYTHPGDFDQPDEDIPKSLQGLTRWFTTLSTSGKPPLILTKTYDPNKYKHYDNYDAINVDKVKDIPWDYDGVMGVPITILDHNLDNVEVVWKGGDIEWAERSNIFTPPPQDIQSEYKHNDETWRVQNPYIITKGKPYCPYNRIFIKKNFEIEGMAASAGYNSDIVGMPLTKPGDARCLIDGKNKYARILIIKKKNEFPRLIIRRKQL